MKNEKLTMKIDEILDILDKIAPFELQESWDNSGLIVGSKEDSFSKVYLSLDVDSELVESLDENSLLIAHHPLIFKGLKQINFDKYPANIINKMIKKDIALISMHTNYDKAYLNRYVAQTVLGYKVIECEEFICYFEVEDKFDAFAKNIQERLKLPFLKTVKAKEFIKKAAITTGSGAELLNSIEADCFLTGDIKYHQAYEAKENNLSMIEIGHFESEIYFANSLSENLKNFNIQAIIANSKNPFTYK